MTSSNWHIEWRIADEIQPPAKFLVAGLGLQQEALDMISDQRVETRPDQHYAAIRTEVSMDGFGDLLGPLWGEVFGWLGGRGVEPAGPPIIRYDVIDMERAMEIEVGVPVGAPVEEDDRVIAGVLPSGRYAVLTHRGDYSGLVEANAALQDWAAGEGLQLDQWSTERGDAFGGRVEFYPTDPNEEPDPARWETEVAYRLADT
jgi:effector-binding domain-containing protein